MLPLRGFIAKQACLVLLLREPAFLSNHSFTGVSHIFFCLQSPSRINYVTTYFDPLLSPYPKYITLEGISKALHSP